MSALNELGAELTRTELTDLRRLTGFMVPASAEFGIPGADDDAIFGDIVRPSAATGVERFQPAHIVIMVANGMGTPRLLLNSATSRFPNGLANSSGLVGKNASRVGCRSLDWIARRSGIVASSLVPRVSAKVA